MKTKQTREKVFCLNSPRVCKKLFLAEEEKATKGSLLAAWESNKTGPYHFLNFFPRLFCPLTSLTPAQRRWHSLPEGQLDAQLRLILVSELSLYWIMISHFCSNFDTLSIGFSGKSTFRERTSMIVPSPQRMPLEGRSCQTASRLHDFDIFWWKLFPVMFKSPIFLILKSPRNSKNPIYS